MKILRFGISDDTYGGLPTEQRSWYLAAEKLAAASGEPWETTLERAWPGGAFVELVEKRLEEEAPDLVLICCAAYWVSYPSAPLAVQRSKFPLARRVARAGFWAASRPKLANRGAFHAARRALTTGATTAFFYDPEVALRRIEAALRAVLRHEEVAVAVRGPGPVLISGSAQLRAYCERRRAAFDDGLAQVCHALHVEYRGFLGADTSPLDELLGDRIHVNAKGHARRAEEEGEVMLRAWRTRLGLSGDQ